MYIVIVVLLLLVLPVGSISAELFAWHSHAPVLALVGKWFVFWSVGVRLFLAGLRQTIQPTFTAREIFHFKTDEPLKVIRELGFANLAMGSLGILSIFDPDLIFPAAITGGIYYALAGAQHIATRSRSLFENVAMVSDVFIFVVLAFYIVTSSTLFVLARLAFDNLWLEWAR
jgi:hypothetical protein